jgi:hypothetical protein
MQYVIRFVSGPLKGRYLRDRCHFPPNRRFSHADLHRCSRLPNLKTAKALASEFRAVNRETRIAVVTFESQKLRGFVAPKDLAKFRCHVIDQLIRYQLEDSPDRFITDEDRAEAQDEYWKIIDSPLLRNLWSERFKESIGRIIR